MNIEITVRVFEGGFIPESIVNHHLMVGGRYGTFPGAINGMCQMIEKWEDVNPISKEHSLTVKLEHE